MEQLKGWSGLLIKLALLLVTVFLAIVSPRSLNVIAAAENWASDLRVYLLNQPKEQHPEIIIVTITEDTLATLAYRSPVDREFLADLLETLNAKNPQAIGLDILFDQPTEAAKDERLREIMSASPVPVIVGWTDRATGLTERQYSYQKQYLKGVLRGYSNLFKDPLDGTVRYMFPGRDIDGKFEKSFTAEIAGSLGREAPNGRVRILYRGNPDSETHIFRKYPAHAAKFMPTKWFEGKIILVGGDLPFEDLHRTPFAAGAGLKGGEFPGVEIQAHMLAQVLEGKIEDKEDFYYELFLAFLLAIVAVHLIFSNLPAWLKITEGISAILAFWVVAICLFRELGISVPMFSPSLSYTIILGVGSAFVAYLNGRQARFIHGAFSRYLSPDMVARVANEPDSLRLGGARRDMTLLFCDFRGFTSLSERLTALELTRLLNRVLTPLTDIILANKGTIDKYMGDCIMAFWNAPLDNGEHARDGCRAALLMLDKMDEINAILKQDAETDGGQFYPLQIGCGLNSGECVVGNMGSEQRFDYSVLGDTVNTAARLEGQSKTYGVDIVIGEATMQAVPGFAMLELDLIQVKGKEQGIRIFALLGDESLAEVAAFQSLITTHAEMLDAYRKQKWKLAREKVAKARAQSEEMKLDELYSMYIKRIDWYEVNPLPLDWDGVFIADSK